MVYNFLKFLSIFQNTEIFFFIYNKSFFLCGYYRNEIYLKHVKDLLFVNCIDYIP